MRPAASKVSSSYDSVSDTFNIRIDWAGEDAETYPSLVAFLDADIWAEYPLTTETLKIRGVPESFPNLPLQICDLVIRNERRRVSFEIGENCVRVRGV